MAPRNCKNVLKCFGVVWCVYESRTRSELGRGTEQTCDLERSKSFAIAMSFPRKPNAARSLLRLAAIQCFERVKDPAGLPPKICFVAA